MTFLWHRIAHAFGWGGQHLKYEFETVECRVCGWRYVFQPEDNYGGGW